MSKNNESRQALNEEIAALKPGELFRPLDMIRKNAPPLEPLWGYFLFKKALTAIIGDPGICKTTFGYGLGMALCKGETFLNIGAEEPIKVLYLDFESADSLIASRTALISDTSTPNFYVYNIIDYYLPNIAETAIHFCQDKSINLIFIDNQSMAFRTRDENDNAEAIRQMRLLRSFNNACNSAAVLFHHTSKANLPGTRKGSGAFARARLADIAVNLEAPSEEQKDVIMLETVKNRLIEEKVLWYFKKEEGQFIFCEPPLGVAGVQTDTQVYKTQKIILEFMEQSVEYQYNELLSLANDNGLDGSALEYAIKKLIQQGRVTKPKRGFYLKRQAKY